MRSPLFTIHAGEYLVGSRIEAQFPWARVWVPSRDTGVDLLVTDSSDRRRSVALQVKTSKNSMQDPGMASKGEEFRREILACGWWTYNFAKMGDGETDLWVLVMLSLGPSQTQYVLIPPEELKDRLRRIHPKGIDEAKPVHSYLLVTRTGKAWETRGLSGKDEDRIVEGTYRDDARDFSRYLNAWDLLANSDGRRSEHAGEPASSTRSRIRQPKLRP